MQGTLAADWCRPLYQLANIQHASAGFPSSWWCGPSYQLAHTNILSTFPLKSPPEAHTWQFNLNPSNLQTFNAQGTLAADGVGLLVALLGHFCQQPETPRLLVCTHFHEVFDEAVLPR